MCCCSCPLEHIRDVDLFQSSFFGEKLKAIPVVRQVGCCDDDAAIVLIACKQGDSESQLCQALLGNELVCLRLTFSTSVHRKQTSSCILGGLALE